MTYPITIKTSDPQIPSLSSYIPFENYGCFSHGVVDRARQWLQGWDMRNLAPGAPGG